MALKIGYARTSTTDQNLDAQVAALEAADCGVIRTAQRSGSSLDGRPELKTIVDFIGAGETLVVTRIDRLARSMRDPQIIVSLIKEKGAHLAATEQPVDTSTATGKAFFDMLGVTLSLTRVFLKVCWKISAYSLMLYHAIPSD